MLLQSGYQDSNHRCTWCLKPPTQRKGDPQRFEIPPQPSRPGRGRNLRRANVAPLRTADRLTPCAARLRRLALTGFGLAEFVRAIAQADVNSAPPPFMANPAFHFVEIFPQHRRHPWALSSMPTDDAAAVLSGWLFERLDVSQSRVPAVPQQCQAPEGSRRPCLWGGLGGERGLGQASPLSRSPHGSGNANHHPRERMPLRREK